MSMSLLILFRFLETLAAYLFLTLVLPCFFLSKKLSQYRFMDRILFYFIIGNFYAVNLVFLLQLLHISNFITLWVGLLVLPVIILGQLDQALFLDRMSSFGHSCWKLLTGSIGIRTVIDSLWRKAWGHCIRGLKKAVDNIGRNWLDWMLIIVLTLMTMWVYGIPLLRQFGYAASDIPVHMYWVNLMKENHIFWGDIYPHGMHAVIYLINELFGIDIYVVFLVFALIQCLVIHMMALLFLKLCCRSRYAAYTGVFLYVICSYFVPSSRYLSALPQETSMIYILPTVYYVFRFFQEKRKELKEGLPEKTSKLALACFTMSFSLCVATHFYGALIAVLYFVGIAVGYLSWLIKPAYFKRIIVAVFISLMIALLPMGIALIAGNSPHAGLFWGISVISDSVQQEEEQVPDDPLVGPLVSEDTSPSTGIRSLGDYILRFLMDLWKVSGETIETYTMTKNTIWWFSLALRGMIVFLIVAGAVLLLSRERMYGAIQLSTGIFMFLMLVMLSAAGLGIIELVDTPRTYIFFSYMMIVVVGFAVDVCMCALAFLSWSRSFKDILSFAVVTVFGLFIWRQDMIRSPLNKSGLESNEAIICLINIIATEPDYSWTIFSANDETQMVFEHGFHYELITFLQEIETLGQDAVTVPTETVYFFIEKIPLDYAVTYEDSGQPVSPDGAQRPLPIEKGLSVYMRENRWIVMSHMYYWAQAFQRLYPNEMKVYLETDQFICYRLEQNPYKLYDLAIDYGFNSVKPEEQ